MPTSSISTDVIVGFPGESKQDFQDTLDVMDKVSFDFAYMFKYSSRPGTKAAEYSDQISEQDKQKRLEILIGKQREITLNNNKSRIGSIQKVMIEKESKKSDKYWSGRTEGNIWTIIKKTNENIKDIVPVIVKDARGVSLFAERINN